MSWPQIMTWTSETLLPGTPAVAATSRGLRYGDGVFVTLRIHGGVLLDAALQMNRLLEAARAIGLAAPARFETPFNAAETLATIVADLDPATTEGVARLQWFAGTGPRGFGRETVRAEALVDLTPGPEPRSPSIVVFPTGHVPLPALPRFKTCSSLANILCAREALRMGADAAVRVESGALLETASANVFWICDGTLFTPSASLPLYPGSVRERILECAPAVGLVVEDGEFGADALVDAQTVFLANAVRGIEVVRSVDGRAMGPPPPITAELRTAVEARRIERGIPLDPGAADADA
jgi:branched-subunit amino acid aminotransferase/4-amino-4-deoxychorismate lyase